MANLEDLRKLRYQLAEIEIENQSYKLLSDAEDQLREALNQSELAAVKSVNKDLKDQIARLRKDVEKGKKNKDGSQRLLDDLKNNLNKL